MPRRANGRSGFTLIELLVVIAIVATLIGLLLPALGDARQSAKAVREQSGMKQVLTAYLVYADDHDGRLLIGFPSDDHWNEMAADGSEPMNLNGNPVGRTAGKRYPWRLIPYLDFQFDALYQDPRVMQSLAEGSEAPEANAFASETMEYLVSLYPSFGLNSYFIGGGANGDTLMWTQAGRRIFGKFHIDRLTQALHPSKLMAFSSARGLADPSVLPGYGTVDGYFIVKPPYLYETSGPDGRQWDLQYADNPESPERNSGGVDLRYKGKGIAGMLDGHAEQLGWDEYNDMRLWSNDATRQDWVIEANLP